MKRSSVATTALAAAGVIAAASLAAIAVVNAAETVGQRGDQIELVVAEGPVDLPAGETAVAGAATRPPAGIPPPPSPPPDAQRTSAQSPQPSRSPRASP